MLMASPVECTSPTSPPAASQTTDSLLHRLAGPSVGKAGLAKDQTEINQIIAEASKGSKFYENEKRKDKELTERIERILKKRDEVMKGADIAKAEAAFNRLLTEIEIHRDFSQTIVHVDMDAFFANVELRYNPKLAGKAFGVGFGVLTTASYEARKFGVRSGMPSFIAKKLCPHLILVKNHFERYQEMSGKVMAVFRRYDPNMCVAGCDEGYLNITEYCSSHNLDPEECVRQMRQTVFEETQLTVSAGIAPNKMLAKICSDKNKPNGQFTLPFTREAVLDFVRELPIRRIPGIGRVNERVLDSLGVKTCGDVQAYRTPLLLLDNATKALDLRHLVAIYLGIGSNDVRPGQREERKSVGAERTFNALSDPSSLLAKLDDITSELAADMRDGGWAGKTVTLKYKTDGFQVFTRAKSLNRWITSKDDLFAVGKELLLHEGPLTLRLLGLRVTKLKDLRESEPSSGIMKFLKPVPQSPRSSAKKRNVALTEEDALPQLNIGNQDEEIVDGWEESDDEHAAILDLYTASGETPSEIISNVADPASLAEGYAGECPICGKHLSDADNADLNGHIDWCLSKQAIREAQRSSDADSVSGVPLKVGCNEEEVKGKRKRGAQKDEGLKRVKKTKADVQAFFKPRSRTA